MVRSSTLLYITMIIGVDLDDVLLSFFDTFCNYINTHRGTSYTRNSLTSFYLESSWGWSTEEASKAIREFYASHEHISAAPVTGAQEAIARIGKKHELHIITSKPDYLREATEKWIERFYPDSFKRIHFTNQFHSESIKRTKAQVCKEIGATILIDDSLENARNVAAEGIKVFLLDAPWNREEVIPPIVRAYSWEEIANLL